MSLSAREQQALDCIEDELAGSDPKLAWLLATFARHASGEEMPVREKIPNLALRRGNVRRPARRLFPRLGLQQTMLLLWLTVTIALIAVALVLNRDSRNGPCPESRAVACTQQAPRPQPAPCCAQDVGRPGPACHRGDRLADDIHIGKNGKLASNRREPAQTHLMIGANP
jgi:Protein of unknown function (DUF3040)